MKTPPPAKRLSSEDLAVVLSVSAIALLGLSFLFGVPLMPTLIMLILSAASLLIYGALPTKTETDILPSGSFIQTEEDYLTAQTNMADNIADAVVMVDPRERVMYANPAARQLLRIKELGRPLSTYVREPGVRAAVQQALAGQTTQAVTFDIEESTERHIRLMASPFTLDVFDPPRPMALLFFYDVTEYTLVDNQRADFLANASHELKTPIASLLGYIETLRGHAKDDPEAQEKFLGIMQSQAERMQRLINDLLSLRRIEQNEHIAPSETADVFLAAKAAIEAAEPLAQKRDVKIKLKSNKKRLVTGHQDELVQLVLNLLDNAIKISAPSTKVTVTIDLAEQWNPAQAFAGSDFSEAAGARRIVSPAITDRAYYVLKLRDHGPGFAREHLPRIGERFYRIAGDLSSKEKGTGLGLAIVKHIVRRHRGGLLIQSGPGEGTEFTVLLPAAEKPLPQ
ncbi:ATP-binding protein [Hellea sp.]|nr:ATP-binding protein [Hellea sp.]